jgi:uncharacterized repeat protein (TIGR02543 family)
VTTDLVINLCEWEPMSCPVCLIEPWYCKSPERCLYEPWLCVEEPSLTVRCNGSGAVTASPLLSGPSENLCGKSLESILEPGTMLLLHAAPAAGWTFVGWSGACSGADTTCEVTMSEAKEVTAEFDREPVIIVDPIPGILVLKKSAGGTDGTGKVSSKPKGINCGSACDEAVALMHKEQVVVLKAQAGTGTTIASWTGCESSTGVGGAEGTCTVSMTKAKEVKVTWAGTSRAIIEPKALTLSKGESSGKGTVKAAGMACEAECADTEVLYQGPVLSPKFKAGKAVELKETPAFGSEFTGWSGACSGSEPTCIVTMEEAKSVIAKFAAKPNAPLKIEKNSYESGTGTVTSKPKAINCATTCTRQDASVPEGEAIMLKEKPALGMTFTGWSGGGCSGAAETCTVKLSEATTVTATFSGARKAIAEAKTLTLNKVGSGFGTVKATGLTCEALCTSATSLYAGPVTSPKVKAGATVILKATSAPGSKAVEWGAGCKSNPTPSECVVEMSEDKSITATFDELE